MLFGTKSKDFSNRTRYDSKKRTKAENYTFLNENYAKSGQTVLIGDSITEIFNYYELFYGFCGESGQAVYNRGISGDTSDRMLERFEKNALIIKPRNLVMLIGTNDIGLALPNELTLSDIRKMLEAAREKCPDANIVLQAIYPVNNRLSLEAKIIVGRRSNEEIGEINREIKKLAEKFGAQWLDLTEALSDENGLLSEKFCYDGLHLNARGFEIVAENIIPLLKK